ncbi:MAG: hypothetical protein A2252_09150 [Elusimicrobia bacterium RIFOXYA2_FULL_39_19]|nr:MAG: hypothetical protein A2252_09150 [Elusimicrobia bacterium RIFOXYA2_FULL_39_19]
MKVLQVKSLEHLKKILFKGPGEFFIALNYDCKSSKTVSYDKKSKVFYVTNWIDGTEQELSSRQIMSVGWTNIGKAIKKGAFYYECSGRQQ